MFSYKSYGTICKINQSFTFRDCVIEVEYFFFDTRTRWTFVFKFVSLKFQAVLLGIPIISRHVLNTWHFFITKYFFTHSQHQVAKYFETTFFLTNAKVWFLTCSWHWTTNPESTCQFFFTEFALCFAHNWFRFRIKIDKKGWFFHFSKKDNF